MDNEMERENRAIRYLKQQMTEAEWTAFEEELTQSADLRAELEKGRELLDRMNASNDEAIVRLANSIVYEAIQRGASDIHILPDRRGMTVQLRIDGQLHKTMAMPKDLHAPVVARWKEMAECNVAERQIPQDGRFQIRQEQEEYAFQVNFLPTIEGERVTARLINKNAILMGLDRLGLSPAQLDTVHRLIERPYGFVLTGGQHNTGKTTLLYSLLNELNSPNARRRNILTVEDPVEYRINGLSQTAVNRRAGLTFGAALRSMIRCNPDVVYCSQFRDLETTEIATELALSRCLVLGQLHVGCALLLPLRLQEMGIVPFLVAQCLNGAIAQRLARKVCQNCVTEYRPKEEDLQKAGLSAMEDGPFRHGAGCDVCLQTGFKGRIGLFEVLEIDNTLRKLIAESAPVETLWQASFGQTGGSLWDDARAKVRSGLTTVEEVNWALFDYPVLPAGALNISMMPF